MNGLYSKWLCNDLSHQLNANFQLFVKYSSLVRFVGVVQSGVKVSPPYSGLRRLCELESLLSLISFYFDFGGFFRNPAGQAMSSLLAKNFLCHISYCGLKRLVPLR